MNATEVKTWKAAMPEFREKTDAFYAGELNKGAYKGFSGYYGSYAQKDGKASMLRLRMPAGRVTGERLAFVTRMIREYGVKRVHFTTCQTIQLHDLKPEQLYPIMEQALDAGIAIMGGGGDFPRNVMCSPLSGLEQGEYFDVLPWAEAAGEYLLQFIDAEKMPRKLKVCFSNSPANITHATYRDLGFAARPDGKFDVYSAGGLGNNPRFGVKVAEAVAPEKILYYIKAMWLTFRAYGNYENRGKARTRYMQEACGGPEAYAAAFGEKLAQVLESGENLDISPRLQTVEKAGDGVRVSGRWVTAQKQNGLYAVAWHPLGGQPDLSVLCRLSDLLGEMEGAEMRLAPDETAYIVNLTGGEAERVLSLIQDDNAGTLFEASVSCIGSATCQVGLRDSQGLLSACVKAVREAGIPDGALPQMHISGCPSSCGTHQTGSMGFRGASRKVDGELRSAFTLYVGGNALQGKEQMGREIGILLEKDIPAFLVELGRRVSASGLEFSAWLAANPQGVEELAAPYLA